jgi:hypothetical protein
MKKTWFLVVAVVGRAMLSSLSLGYCGGLSGGGAISNEFPYCISPEQAAEIKHTVEIYEKSISGPQLLDMTTGMYTFYPMGGTLFRDVYVNNYVDIDSSSGVLDLGCDDWAYDGHDAYDIDIRSFGEQAIGVPIFAVQDGTVIASHDGEFDMNITAANQPANLVPVAGGQKRKWLWRVILSFLMF